MISITAVNRYLIVFQPIFITFDGDKVMGAVFGYDINDFNAKNNNSFFQNNLLFDEIKAMKSLTKV